MADIAPSVAAEEYRESLAAVDRKAEALANQIKKSKHFIVFTGAGVRPPNRRVDNRETKDSGTRH
ncbi:DHS-like NAD/FAD-binding domain-containing protein [Penicillium canariense]|uniref:DHS-like NAD/FAD-binding domain-containing protein n=1 Tax=Penicillium canariense TaxID=189055 RepID=A0A9W9IGJ2_9EURO|nr:DHS-like NAD/FAD-binding domain-containing protein [Penicillium canariense]KAJ5177159.1 DHS-like NAD/FAD-binding domain-containing protein [Penicillium canariense]